MRELRHPWPLLHDQDRKSRQRCSKPRRQCELSGETTQLSLGYLFCHNWGPLKALNGSLGPAFTPAFLTLRKAVRQAFALTLHSRFPTWMSLSLGPSDIFSEGSRPRQTARLPLSSNESVDLRKVGSITYCDMPPRRSYAYSPTYSMHQS